MSGDVDRIPILRIGRVLLTTIQVDMHDRLAIRMEEDLCDAVVRHSARGVMIDISALDVVDSFIGRILARIASMSSILDASTVVVGMRPAVAMTLVELGLDLRGVATALDAERGMALLERSIQEIDMPQRHPRERPDAARDIVRT